MEEEEQFDEVDPDFAPVQEEKKEEPKKKKGPELVALDDDEFPEEEEEPEEEEDEPISGHPIHIHKSTGRPHPGTGLPPGPGSAAKILSGPATVSTPMELLSMSLHQNSFSSGMTRNRNELASILSSMKTKLDIASQTSEVCAKVLKFINDESLIKVTVFYEISSKGNILEIAFSAIKMSGTKVEVPRETEGEIMAVILASPNTTNPMTGYTVEFGIGSSSELTMTVHTTKWSPGNTLKQSYTVLNPDLLL